ncbi:MAG: hypothetical protein K8R40_13195 [Anaerolineaceae bacterium]|nr:hypothetical protein [Anaerolineaceae bacterium]
MTKLHSPQSSHHFSHAIVRLPGLNFFEGLTSMDLGKPDYPTARLQHAAYIAALQEACGLEVNILPANESYPDSTFVEDVTIVTPAFAVLTNPGTPSRAGEVTAIEKIITQEFKNVYRITAPGTLDGGDICEADGHFFIGISHRTNPEGAQQLADILQKNGYTTSFVDIRPLSNILHLKSGIAYIGDDRVVMWEEFKSFQAFDDYEKIITKPEENYAANCLRVNDKILIPADFPDIAQQLTNLGYDLIPLAMEEFEKMDGGLSCLSLRYSK